MADYCIHGKDLTKLTSDPCAECLSKAGWTSSLISHGFGY
jgi:hypothetical protein